MNRVWILAVAAVTSWSCSTELPNVDPTAFACVDDTPIDEAGRLQCPASHACVEGACASRLDCFRSEARDGCEPDLERCEAMLGEQTSSVRCASGLYTQTSTRAPDPVDCDCPLASPNDDVRLLCVAMAGRPVEGGYPLFVLPEGGALPSGSLDVPAEIPEWRWCVRPCSSDASCPVNHTCRPAAVVSDGLLADRGIGRHTVAVCYPNRLLVPTATTSSAAVPLEEPDPDVCLSGVDCEGEGTADVCQYQIEQTPDHPFFPAQQAWSERRALVGRCRDSRGLTPTGRGCTDGSDQVCVSGVCDSGFCARVCDRDTNQDDLCRCDAVYVTRRTDTAEVSDAVDLCAPR